MGDVQFWPDHASNFAWPVDTLYIVLIALSVVFSVPIIFLIFYFGFKYRRSAVVDRTMSHTSNWMEWTAIGGMLVLIVPIFVWSSSLYFNMFRPPDGALEIYVVGQQWMWKMQHPTGQREINQLHVPVGRPVKLIMTSEDVIHSFYVPAFRVKHDVIPGRYTTLWFQATKAGSFHLFCAEYCGTEHSDMVGEVIVMEAADYQAWLSGGGQAQPGAPATQSMAQSGEQLFKQRGCVSCHIAAGGGPGPSLVGVYGSQQQLADGTTVTADDAYIRESILNPTAKVVRGYQPIMPSFQGQVNEQEILQLIAYIRSLGNPGGSGPGQDNRNGTSGTVEPNRPGGASGTAGPNAPGDSNGPGGPSVPGGASGTGEPGGLSATGAPNQGGDNSTSVPTAP
jgi:cytochrome c oxidase subunit 2